MTTPDAGVDLSIEFIADEFGFLADGLDFKMLELHLIFLLGLQEVFFMAFLSNFINQSKIICQECIVFLLGIESLFNF